MPPITKITPKTAQSHLQPLERAAIANSWSPAARNKIPTMTPTRVIEACLNCKMTIEARIQRMPTTNHAHHHLASSVATCRASAGGAPFEAPIEESIVSIALLVSLVGRSRADSSLTRNHAPHRTDHNYWAEPSARVAAPALRRDHWQHRPSAVQRLYPAGVRKRRVLHSPCGDDHTPP